MKKIKQFFRISKYEIKRVMRNKVVFSMLLAFSIILLLILSYIQINTSRYPLAIFADRLDIQKEEVVQLIQENLKTDNITYVNSKEEGIQLVNKNKVCFFIYLRKGEEMDNTTAIFYYDQSNTVARTVANGLDEAKNQYAYDTLTNFLSKYGITLNESYFQTISFEPTNKNFVSIKQMPFALEVICCVSIIIMLGLAYSVSRDNETQVSKNIAYIPIGTNRYLLSKVVPYLLLGLVEVSTMYLLGVLLFEIEFQVNIVAVIALSIFALSAIISLGLLFSMLKSQIATIFMDMLTILLPLFVTNFVYIQACPMYIQILLNLIPITPFISFLNGMMYNGVILWRYIPIFITQSIVYYIITLIILRKRT